MGGLDIHQLSRDSAMVCLVGNEGVFKFNVEMLESEDILISSNHVSFDQEVGC